MGPSKCSGQSDYCSNFYKQILQEHNELWKTLGSFQTKYETKVYWAKPFSWGALLQSTSCHSQNSIKICDVLEIVMLSLKTYWVCQAPWHARHGHSESWVTPPTPTPNHPGTHPPPACNQNMASEYGTDFHRKRNKIDLLCRQKTSMVHTSMVHQTFVQWAWYSLFKFVKSHQTFGPSHRKCPTCPMIFVNTGFRDLIVAAPLNCQRSVRYAIFRHWFR